MPFQPDYPVQPERQAYTFEAPGSETGVLMIHGFMGSPLSSRGMSHYLCERGISVHCPLLPGHGHWPDKFHKVPRQAWLEEAREGLNRVRQMAPEIFILGHSMGNALGAELAARNPDDIRGMVLLAPTYDVPDQRLRLLRLLRYVMPWFQAEKFSKTRALARERILDFDPEFDFDAPGAPERMAEMARVPTGGIDEMRKTLDRAKPLWSQVHVPALILQGADDFAISPRSGQIIQQEWGHFDADFHEYPDTEHELMRDFVPAHSDVWQRVYTFILRHARRLAEPSHESLPA